MVGFILWFVLTSSMKVKDIDYKDEYLLVQADETVREVTRKILDLFPKQVEVIVTDGDEAVGVVYLHMLAKKGIVEGEPEAEVSEAMSDNIIEVSPEDDVSDVKEQVDEEKPLGIIVVGDEGVKGFVSPVDWADMMKEE